MSQSHIIPLTEGLPGQTIRIHHLTLEGTMRRRLLDLGFVPGSDVTVLQRSPLGDPVAFRVIHTTIALRKEESSQIYGELIGSEKNETTT
ncbi:ferrous iron transport protein A [Marininema mesophilum]|uniref:Ferrous iron transport protein A n=1 Tax=Marininema mesophilum TaxID=1048340 RepID=A0A1H2SAQ4_9BACL|nr:FeoA family protein [Marininema mesophilum]SDW28578.1 ferrous iron transport protein A [Marininema mesophilum]